VGEGDRVDPVPRDIDDVTFLLQAFEDEAGNPRVVLDQQDLQRPTSIGAGARLVPTRNQGRSGKS